MEIPTDVIIYIDQINSEPKRGRLLAVNPSGYYEVNLATAGGPRRALLPVARTYVFTTEVEVETGLVTEVER
jgi:accessory colonization factor AcfC